MQFSKSLWRRRLLRAGAMLMTSLVLVVGFHFGSSSSPPKLAAQAATRLMVPENVESLGGQWQFLPAPHADTALKPFRADLPMLDWAQADAIAVPSNWYLAGHDIAGVAWYRHQFQVSPQFAHQALTLSFAGVDYAADVWLNGEYLGFHEGYFQTFEFPVSSAMRFDQDNELVVRVNSPLEPDTPDWSLHKRLIKGVLSHHDARPGGAWSDRGQEKNTGGIWAPVTLRASQGATIQQVHVTPTVAADHQSAIAHVQLDLTVHDPQIASAQVLAQLVPVNFAGTAGEVWETTQTLRAGHNSITFDIAQPQPQLWWTWDHGQPNLYELRLRVQSRDQLLDTNKTQFGFRTVERDAQTQAFWLNGQRIFLRGTNYIPSQWLSELDGDRLQQDIQLMQAAHINSVRVHAHVTAPMFYDQADAAGLLVWQDFPLQWGYEDTPTFAREAIRQAKAMVNQLYNHPAIFAWSLHNEPPWDAEWMTHKYETYDETQNRGLDRLLYQALKPADPSRYLHFASVVAEHPWWGWYSFAYDRYGEPTDQPLITEFGAQALPGRAALERIFEADHLWPQDEADWAVWQYRNFQPHETFELAQVSQGEDLAEFIHNTQTYQAKLHQFAAEAYRRQRYQPVSAIYQFMFCEPWPSISWGMVDYWRQPKPGYAALEQAYQPILPSIAAPALPQPVHMPVPIAFWAINDTWEPIENGTLVYTVKLAERTLVSDAVVFDVAADDLVPLAAIEFEPEAVGDYTITAQIQDSQHHTISENQYVLSVEVPASASNGFQ